MKRGDEVRIVWSGTVTSAGVILKVNRLRGTYVVKHFHGAEEELSKHNVRPALKEV